MIAVQVKRWGKQFAVYALLSSLVAIGLVMGVMYAQYGSEALDVTLVPDYLYYNFDAVLWIIIIEQVAIIIYSIYMQNIRDKKSDCELSVVSLEKLAEVWLGEGYMNKVTEQPKHNGVFFVTKFGRAETNVFFNSYIKPYAKYFTEQEAEITVSLLDIMESDGYDCPSVVDKNEKDHDVQTYKKKKALKSGLTQYDVYATYNLYDHSLRTARKMMELVLRDYNSPGPYAAHAIIMGLAHDIGKIAKLKQHNYLTVDRMNDSTHPVLGEEMFRSMYTEYKNLDLILTGIAHHHQSGINDDPLVKLLVIADKSAREEELNMWYVSQKEARLNEHTANELSRSAEADENPEPVIDVVVQPDSKTKEPSEGKSDKALELMKGVITSEKPAPLKKTEEPEQKETNKEVVNKKTTPKVDPVKEAIDKPSETASKPAPIKRVPTADMQPLEFDFDSIESEFKTKLYENINKKERANILSIIFKNMVLYRYSLIREILGELVPGAEEGNLDGHTKYVIKLLFERKHVAYIRPQNNYFFSTFFISHAGSKWKFICVPVRGEYLGLKTTDLEQMGNSTKMKGYKPSMVAKSA